MPGVGSEPGTGFAWARILAGVGETWVLTRPWPARQAELEAAAAAAPEHAAIHLEYVELPRWLGTTDWILSPAATSESNTSCGSSWPSGRRAGWRDGTASTWCGI